MERFVYIVVTVVLVVFARDVAAQTKPCLRPVLDLIRAAKTATDGEKVAFDVSVGLDNFDQRGLKYKWKVFPRGKFTAGQGTAVALLDTTGLGGNEVIISVEVWPVEECVQIEGTSIQVRRKGPYTKADDFWWWIQLNQTNLRGYRDPEYESMLDDLAERLREVDDRLTVKIEIDRPDPMKQGMIFGYRAKPYNDKVVKDLVSRAPNLLGFDIVIAKP